MPDLLAFWDRESVPLSGRPPHFAGQSPSFCKRKPIGGGCTKIGLLSTFEKILHKKYRSPLTGPTTPNYLQSPRLRVEFAFIPKVMPRIRLVGRFQIRRLPRQFIQRLLPRSVPHWQASLSEKMA